MAGFYYFVPEVGGGRLWRELGLTYAFDGSPSQIEVGPDVGPQGRSGMVFTRQSATRLPQPIVWEKSRCGRFWVGWHEPDPPGPEHLDRGLNVGGSYLQLADGRNWLVPLVLACSEQDPDRESGLPSSMRVVGEEIGNAPLPEYAALIEQAQAFLAVALDETLPAVPTEDVVSYCAALLAVSYRIGVAEVLALGLLTQDNATELALLSIDIGPFDAELGFWVGPRAQAALAEAVA